MQNTYSPLTTSQSATSRLPFARTPPHTVARLPAVRSPRTRPPPPPDQHDPHTRPACAVRTPHCTGPRCLYATPGTRVDYKRRWRWDSRERCSVCCSHGDWRAAGDSGLGGCWCLYHRTYENTKKRGQGLYYDFLFILAMSIINNFTIVINTNSYTSLNTSTASFGALHRRKARSYFIHCMLLPDPQSQDFKYYVQMQVQRRVGTRSIRPHPQTSNSYFNTSIPIHPVLKMPRRGCACKHIPSDVLNRIPWGCPGPDVPFRRKYQTAAEEYELDFGLSLLRWTKLFNSYFIIIIIILHANPLSESALT